MLAGAGVGGGSLVYANTLYEPPLRFFADPQWGHITDWQAELAPHYDQAKRMLGVTVNPTMTPADVAIRNVAERMGRASTFRLTPVGVYFGDQPGQHTADPYFGGAGPRRATPGVNPSLTITAQAERTMAAWPNRGEADSRARLGAAYQRAAAVPPAHPAVPAGAPAALRPPASPPG